MRTLRTKYVVTGAALVILAGCSSSSKVAEQSPVASKGDGSGTAPAAATAKKAEMALVRFVNATTETKGLAFGDTVPFPEVKARDISAYKEVPAERHDFKLMPENAAGSQPLATNSEGLSAGKHYTVIAYAEKDGTMKLDPISDDLQMPAPGQAKVRVINLAPGLEKVDLYATGKKSPVISGTSVDSASDFTDINPSEAELMVRHGISKKNSAPVKDLTMKAGRLYTILVFQDKNRNIKVKSVEDEFTAPMANNG